MKRFAVVLACLTLTAGALTACARTAGAKSGGASTDLARLEAEAADVTITRDDWGIAHVHGKTDADAVFGAIYAQAEDDFNRVETNYINGMGRLAEAEGKDQVWRDLRMKLFIDPDVLKAQYAASPDWLQKLMGAWADGLNFYLVKHPDVKPRVIARFEPWMALSFTEGSIGGDVESGVSLQSLEKFYGPQVQVAANDQPALDRVLLAMDARPVEPGGSNGMAVSPSNTKDHHALLLINPHTSFFFRSELQMTSDEGLNAYGASTWGQFFIYQGFNERLGWMHTSGTADAYDEYAETVTKQGDGWTYKYGAEQRPVATRKIVVPYRDDVGRTYVGQSDAGMKADTFTVYATHHGPIVREADGRWIAMKLMNEPIKALTQSYMRTKARDFGTFKHIFELHTNSSNNTIYADADGNIAFFYDNFIPKRDPKLDWRRPVDGSDPATEWQGLLGVDDSPNLLNPATGWLYNSNDSPWQAAGSASRKQADFPAYVNYGVESARGHHAVRVLKDRKDFTPEGLRAAAFDTYLTWFEKTIPALVQSWDRAPASDPLKAKLAQPIEVLRGWDLRWAATSVPTSVAVYWGDEMRRSHGDEARAAQLPLEDWVATRATPKQRLEGLAAATDKLVADFGKWDTPWGDINRFQRLDDAITSHFDDAGPSIPVGFPAATWGSLASFAARQYPNTKKWYGSSGNSFVSVVEFGDSVRAVAVTAGGESGHPGDKHFADEAERYATGNLRTVYFYPSQLKGHTEREYHPGG